MFFIYNVELKCYLKLFKIPFCFDFAGTQGLNQGSGTPLIIRTLQLSTHLKY